MNTRTTTVAAVARALHMNPKNARAKFRALTSERPFDHTRTHELSRPLALKAAQFLATDFRAAQ